MAPSEDGQRTDEGMGSDQLTDAHRVNFGRIKTEDEGLRRLVWYFPLHHNLRADCKGS